MSPASGYPGDDDLISQSQNPQRREGLSFEEAVNRPLQTAIPFKAQPPNLSAIARSPENSRFPPATTRPN